MTQKCHSSPVFEKAFHFSLLCGTFRNGLLSFHKFHHWYTSHPIISGLSRPQAVDAIIWHLMPNELRRETAFRHAEPHAIPQTPHGFHFVHFIRNWIENMTSLWVRGHKWNSVIAIKGGKKAFWCLGKPAGEKGRWKVGDLNLFHLASIADTCHCVHYDKIWRGLFPSWLRFWDISSKIPHWMFRIF